MLRGRLWPSCLDYRDLRVTGDAKVVWEPIRHHHLVVLARAYRATGDVRYASAVVEQLESWLEQCPFGQGMNWRSPLELAIRLINWVWAVDLIREAGLVKGMLQACLRQAAYLHLWEITRKYSRGSSANNHRIGEAAGVFTASSSFPDWTMTGAGSGRAARFSTRRSSPLLRGVLVAARAHGGVSRSPGRRRERADDRRQ